MAQYKKGQSGNPRGRPPGLTKTAKLREAIGEHLPDIIRALVTAARDGDTAAAKLLLDRGLAPLKPVDQPATFAVAESLSGTGQGILDAVAAGEITPEQAGRLLRRGSGP